MTLRVSCRLALTIVGIPVVAAAGCSGSATTSIVGPSSSKCEISVTNNLASVPAAGASGQLTVATNRECPWSARTEAPWITLSTAEGHGPAAVNYTVALNAAAAPRQGAVVVVEQRVAVIQEAAPCRYAVSPSNRDVLAAGEQISVNLTTLDGCAWTARSDAEWIAVANPSAGQGNASVRFDVRPNPGPVRSGAVTIGDQVVRINQAPGAQPSPVPPAPGPSPAPAPDPPNPTCAYAVSPTRKPVAPSGEALTVSVLAASGCSWNASSAADWIKITAGESGSGNGSVRVTVDPNSGAARSASLTVAGQSVTLEQPEAPAPTPSPCNYSVAPMSRSIGRDETVIPITVVAADTCSWTAASQAGWITIADGRSGSGNGTVRLVASSNSGSSRSGTVTVGGRTVTVQQDGGPCTYSIKPGSYSAGRGPDNVLVSVAAGDGCAWTAASNASWVSVTEGRTGSGNGTVRLTVEANSGAARTANLTIAGQPFTLEQAQGVVCQPSIKPTSYHAGRGPDDIRITVTADPGCRWTATSPVSWVTVVEGREGAGAGTVRLLVQANHDEERRAILTIAGQLFTLLQNGDN